MQDDIARRFADLTRRVENMLSIGVIAELDNEAVPPLVRVEIEGRLSGWMPQPCEIGANFRRWRPLRPGTQVLVAAISGDPAHAVIVAILNSAVLPQPEQADSIDVVAFDDGTVIRHDAAAKRTEISNPDGTLVLDFKNVVTRIREGGYLHQDHAGRATRLTHLGDTLFKAESWTTGSVVVPEPDQGFSPPRVTSPAEAEGG